MRHTCFPNGRESGVPHLSIALTSLLFVLKNPRIISAPAPAPEQIGIKKVLNRDIKPVADLLDGRNRCAPVPAADYIVESRLSDAAHSREFIDCNAALTAKLQYSLPHSISDVHRIPPQCYYYIVT